VVRGLFVFWLGFWQHNNGVAWLAGFAFFTWGASWTCRAWHGHWDWHCYFFFNGRGRLYDGGGRRIDGGFFASGQADDGEHGDEDSCFHGVSFLKVVDLYRWVLRTV
jgi:hypothetical protein